MDTVQYLIKIQLKEVLFLWVFPRVFNLWLFLEGDSPPWDRTWRSHVSLWEITPDLGAPESWPGRSALARLLRRQRFEREVSVFGRNLVTFTLQWAALSGAFYTGFFLRPVQLALSHERDLISYPAAPLNSCAHHLPWGTVTAVTGPWWFRLAPPE